MLITDGWRGWWRRRRRLASSSRLCITRHSTSFPALPSYRTHFIFGKLLPLTTLTLPSLCLSLFLCSSLLFIPLVDVVDRPSVSWYGSFRKLSLTFSTELSRILMLLHMYSLLALLVFYSHLVLAICALLSISRRPTNRRVAMCTHRWKHVVARNKHRHSVKQRKARKTSEKRWKHKRWNRFWKGAKCETRKILP